MIYFIIGLCWWIAYQIIFSCSKKNRELHHEINKKISKEDSKLVKSYDRITKKACDKAGIFGQLGVILFDILITVLLWPLSIIALWDELK